ncbi:MAG TPA: hypothetical protein VGI80_03440 [Pyrinomonadaceae bacterium]
MKIVFGTLMIAALGVGMSAQQTEQRAKVLAEVSTGTQAIKGQPFSADTVSESVQTLADGNRIVQTSNGKIYRNSEGRVRREITGGNGGSGGLGANTYFFNYGPGISIAEPAGGRRVLLNEQDKTARTVTVVPETEVRVTTRSGTGEGVGSGAGVGTGVTTLRAATEASLTDEQKKALEILKGHREGDPYTPEQQKAREVLQTASIMRAQGSFKTMAPLAATGPVLAVSGAGLARGLATASGDNWFVGGLGDSKWETKTDDLGTQNIEGVTCEGTRRTTTIPAGAIGNERPIEIVYERWFSKDLGMVVSSKHSDPRFGEQTYTLKNVVRAEPDPALFTVPREFKFMTEPGAAAYKVRTSEAEREFVRAKAATAPTAPTAPKQP